MKQEELKRFLRSHDAPPRKSFSQNFFVDKEVVNRLVDALEIEPEEPILEVGPGAGAITEVLLERGAQVTAIEKDRRLAAALQRLDLTVISDDALTTPLESLPKGKFISNLPHHIATPIVTRFLPQSTTMVFTLQKELGERYIGKAMSPISIYMAFHATIEELFIIDRTAFYPTPKVDAIALRVTPKKPPLEESDAFFSMVKTAFQQRRKMLRKSLGECGRFETKRPEELSLHDWLELYFLRNR